MHRLRPWDRLQNAIAAGRNETYATTGSTGETGNTMKKILLASMLATALFSVQASAKDVVASSFCPMTGSKGIGRGPTFEAAVDNAIKACIAKGGVSSCCYKFTRRVS